MRSIYAFLLAILSFSPAAAQTASLVRDIATSSQGSSEGSAPESFHGIPGKVFFVAEEPGSGKELWVSDGTGAGTQMLADVCVGECSSSPFLLGSLAGTLFFEDRGDFEGELWRSDGTRAGTFSLTPPESGVVYKTGILTLGASPYLLFAGCTQGQGCNLWRSDGTLPGTRLVKELPNDIAGLIAAEGRTFLFTNSASLWVTDGTEAGTVPLGTFPEADLHGALTAGGRLFFLSSTPQTEYQLWASDGTVPGTRRLTDFPGEQAFFPMEHFRAAFLQPAGKRLYFLADDSVHGFELWRSDGTVAGTRRLTDFDYPLPFPLTSGRGFPVEEIQDRAVFIATDGVTLHKVWTSTGDPQSVAPLPDPCGGACEFLPDFPWLIRAGDRVFYSANDGQHGFELWATDGTVKGTKMLQDICSGDCSGFESYGGIRAFGSRVLFIGRSTFFDSELFVSDGTPGGTRSVTQFGDQGGLFDLEAAFSGDRIFFAGGDGRGEELWVSEGGVSRLVADINRNEPSSDPERLTAHGSQVFFNVTTGWQDLWRSDGTFEGTVPITRSDTFLSRLELTSAGAWLFYLEGSGGEQGLWRTDGTAAGTIPLLQNQDIREIEAFQGRAIFTRWSDNSLQVWSSDGTPSGTHLALGLPTGHFPYHLRAVENDLYFVTSTQDGECRLWRWNGVSAAASEVAAVFCIPSSDDLQLTLAGSRLFFIAGHRLWVADSSPAGASPLTSINGPYPLALEAFGGQAWFLTSEPGLWRSDGTSAGTVLVRELPLDEPNVEYERTLVAVSGRLYFPASGAGVELWSSDGTTAGTGMLRDILPGRESGLPQHLTPADGRLFFTARETVHGIELWQTDGTPQGTRLVQDIAPMAASSDPDELTVAGDRLFFTADDRLSGRELWSLPLAASGCQASPTRLCLNNGRFQVEAVWRDFQGNAGKGTAVALTPDTGYFWFFDPSNVETIVKVLNGQGVNGHHWVFYGALSTVDYTLTVTDTQTGLSRRYHNPAGRLASVGDTNGFGPLGAFSRTNAPAGIPCQATDERLCLENGRFAVEAEWKDFQGNAGKGKAVGLTPGTGYFWFFDSANVEVVVKVLDGTSLNGKHWVFYGALSSVEYKITVTDTQTGKIKVYENPSGRLASVADTSAF